MNEQSNNEQYHVNFILVRGSAPYQYPTDEELMAELREQESDVEGFDLYDLSDCTTYEDLQAQAEWLELWDELDSEDCE